MPAKRLLIVQTGHAIASVRGRLGDFPQWFRVAMALPRSAVDIADVQNGEALPRIRTPAARDIIEDSLRVDEPAHCASNGAAKAAHQDYAGIVITGSGAMVSDREPWSEATAAWVREVHAANIPLLGVCYGHQLIAHAFGGRVDYHPGGREMGTYEVERLDGADDDALFHHAPRRFSAQLTHRQSVLEAPDAAVVLARSAHDPVQAFRIGTTTWGVQFHPEFSTAAMRSYIAARAADLTRENTCPRSLANAVHAAPHARAILRRFTRVALGSASAT